MKSHGYKSKNFVDFPAVAVSLKQFQVYIRGEWHLYLDASTSSLHESLQCVRNFLTGAVCSESYPFLQRKIKEPQMALFSCIWENKQWNSNIYSFKVVTETALGRWQDLDLFLNVILMSINCSSILCSVA